MSVKQALVLVNMGGPASTEEIAPYMRAIFADPFILPLPWLLRGFVSNKIVKKRTQPVIEKYNLIGGKSPLLKWTEKQVKLMRRNDSPLFEHITHAYRYTSPTLDQTFASLKKGGYQSVTILPMFPHSSRAMTGSIEHEAKRLAKRHSITTYTIDAWGLHKEIIALQSEYLKSAMDEAGTGARVLFVAHGIPMREVKRGDNYPDKVSENAAMLAETLPAGTDWGLAYQSRVGPIEWTQPYLEDELERLAKSSDPVVIMPLSFVADCLETLYDLDRIAAPELLNRGVSKVVRVPVYNDDPRFIERMAQLVNEVCDA